jgi:hypothetical protein
MGGNKRFPLKIYDIAILTIIIPFLFYYSGKIYWMILELSREIKIGTITEKLFILFLILFSFPGIVIIDIIWILFAIYGPFKNARVKIYITVFLLTISAMALCSLVGGMALSGSMH